MGYDYLKEMDVDMDKGKIVLTTREPLAGPGNWERWIFKPTQPIFEVRLAELTRELLSGRLVPLQTCNHQALFSMLAKALCSLSVSLYNYSDLYKDLNEKVFIYFVAKAITIPYFKGIEIDMDKIVLYIKETLSPNFYMSYIDVIHKNTANEVVKGA